MSNIDIPILSGTFFNLELFDFSFAGIRIISIESKEFKDYITKYSPKDDFYNYNIVETIIKESHGEYDKKYAIVKNDPLDKFRYDDVYNVFKILLIIHPSDLQIQYELHFQVLEGVFTTLGYSSMHRLYSGEYPGKPLFNKETYVPEINEFIRRVFALLDKSDYIGLAIFNYLISYQASHDHYQYTSLFTALDSLIDGSGTELQYRLKRGIAILCGENEYDSGLIYGKVNKLSKLRNNIVHGNSYDMEKVSEYLPKMKALASRVIIELLVHNISKEELNKAFTSLGFGDRNKISKNWKGYQLNLLAIIDANWLDLDN